MVVVLDNKIKSNDILYLFDIIYFHNIHIIHKVGYCRECCQQKTTRFCKMTKNVFYEVMLVLDNNIGSIETPCLYDTINFLVNQKYQDIGRCCQPKTTSCPPNKQNRLLF